MSAERPDARPRPARHVAGRSAPGRIGVVAVAVDVDRDARPLARCRSPRRLPSRDSACRRTPRRPRAERRPGGSTASAPAAAGSRRPETTWRQALAWDADTPATAGGRRVERRRAARPRPTRPGAGEAYARPARPAAVASADGGRVEGVIVDHVVPVSRTAAYTLAKAVSAGAWPGRLGRKPGSSVAISDWGSIPVSITLTPGISDPEAA